MLFGCGVCCPLKSSTTEARHPPHHPVPCLPRSTPQLVITPDPANPSSAAPGSSIKLAFTAASSFGSGLQLRAEATATCGAVQVSPATLAVGGSFTATLSVSANAPATACALTLRLFDAADAAAGAKAVATGSASLQITSSGGSGGSGSVDLSRLIATMKSTGPRIGQSSVSFSVTADLPASLTSSDPEAPASSGRRLLASSVSVVLTWGDGSPDWQQPVDPSTKFPATWTASHTYAKPGVFAPGLFIKLPVRGGRVSRGRRMERVSFKQQPGCDELLPSVPF